MGGLERAVGHRRVLPGPGCAARPRRLDGLFAHARLAPWWGLGPTPLRPLTGFLVPIGTSLSASHPHACIRCGEPGEAVWTTP